VDDAIDGAYFVEEFSALVTYSLRFFWNSEVLG
jgi:hypothetical protein